MKRPQARWIPCGSPATHRLWWPLRIRWCTIDAHLYGD